MQASELRWVASFAALSPGELAAFGAVARKHDYRRGECLFRAGQPCERAEIVLTGFVRLARPLPDGGDVTTGVVRPGGLLSAVPLRVGGAHLNDAVALSPGTAVEFPVADLLALGRRCPRVLSLLAGNLRERLDDAVGDGAVRGSVAQRLLAALRRLARDEPRASAAPDGAMARVAVPLSHADFAALVNADRETVTRALRALEAQGLIRRERGHVIAVAKQSPTSAGANRR